MDLHRTETVKEITMPYDLDVEIFERCILGTEG
jgi:hypothetical protein